MKILTNSRSNEYSTDYKTICAIKGISPSTIGQQGYKSALTSLYHAVCLDIDDTITYKCATEKRLIVEALTRLTKLNLIICFITGRGKTSAFEFLVDLKNSIMEFEKQIKESQFRRWYCITNNGFMLFSNDFLNESGFLTRSVSLVSADVKKEYLRLKPELQDSIAELLAESLHVEKNEIISESNRSSGENSLRFPFNSDYDGKIDDSLIEKIRNIVSRSTEFRFGVNRGVYHQNNKTVIEISMTTKGYAIDRFEEHLGIPKNKMVRIGDQGDPSGNDYEMLNCLCGFSVGKYSHTDNSCWPVVTYDGVFKSIEIITGVSATIHLLNKLKLFPTLCLEKPSEEIYLPRLAMSESKNIVTNRDTYEYYENQLKYALRNNNNRFITVWDYIDEQTGGFYVHDSEYELLKAYVPNHILFRIYDSQILSRTSGQPRLKFALKNDKGLLLRGPLNYYYGLSFRNEGGDNITKGFLKELNQKRIHFFKTCLYVLKSSQPVNAKDSITRRVILGIMDSIRDYLIIILNIHLQEHIGANDMLFFYRPKYKQIFNIYIIAKENLIYLYNCLFDNIDANFINHFLEFLQNKIMPLTKETEKYLESLIDFEYKKGCRVWREIDSFFENIVAIDTSINKLLFECDVEKKELLMYGIRYGSLELPIIAAMLFDVKYKYFGIKYSVGALCLKTNYIDNHESELDSKRVLSSVNRRGVNEEKYFHILMDDNLVTGRTLQLAVNMLVNREIFPNKIFVVRYPSINRIKHMFLPNHGAPDTDLFWEYVYGLTSPTPYSKLNNPCSFKNEPTNKYLDELGQFNKTRTYVLGLLYKNGIFASESEVKSKCELL